jgi:uncharacterized protein
MVIKCGVMAVITLVGAGCGSSGDADEAFTTREVLLPDGFQVRAELALTAEEQARGLMYRESLADGKGMLFVHTDGGSHAYWMANCRIPLDIIWMDAKHGVVEISANTPPCPKGGPDCPTYGGHFPAQYVLELGGGQAARHRVQPGAVLQF